MSMRVLIENMSSVEEKELEEQRIRDYFAGKLENAPIISKTTGEEEGESAAATATTGEGGNEIKRKKRSRKKKKKLKNYYYYKNAVYVTGLPLDTNEEEVVKYFSKCGFIEVNAKTGNKFVKLYRLGGGDGKDEGLLPLKGDALVVYHLSPSVELAIEILHDTDFRDGFRISVERAKVTSTADSVGKSEKKVKYDGEIKEKVAKIRKLEVKQGLSWNEEGLGDSVGNKIVVLKNVFNPEEFKADPVLRADLERDFIDECAKIGRVKKITLFENNPEGVVMIKFHSAAPAESCVKIMNGRYFDRRQVMAEFWDGETDYRTKVSNEEEKDRLEAFGKWLESGDNISDDDDEEEEVRGGEARGEEDDEEESSSEEDGEEEGLDDDDL
jgi:HIV Tat-specific factor 1